MAINEDYSGFIEFMNATFTEEDDEFVDHVFDKGNQRVEKAKEILAKAAWLAPFLAALKKNEVLQIVFSPEVQEKLNQGAYHLMNTVDGAIKAVAVDDHNVIRELGEVKIDSKMEIDPKMLVMVMMALAILKGIDDIKVSLREITAKLDDVRAGQHSDRMAQYYAAESMYREAMRIENPQLRHELKVQALQSLSTSIAQLALPLREDVRAITDQFDENKFEIKVNKETRSLISQINGTYDILHRAYRLKTAIYYSEGEYLAVAGVLAEYKQLLLATVAKEKSYKALYYADDSQRHIVGVWTDRAKELPQKIDGILVQLRDPSQYCIEFGMEEVA